jgi:serine protease AprX
MKRVMVFTMHETEQTTAGQHLQNATVTDGYSLGAADDAAIAAMEAAGLVVQEIEDAPATPVSFSTFSAQQKPLPGYYLAWLAPPIVPDCHRSIETTGARLVEKQDDWYLFYVETKPQLDALVGMSFVRSVRPYLPSDTTQVLLKSRVLTAQWDLLLHPHANRPALEQWLVDAGIRIVASSDIKVRIEAGKDIAVEAAGRVEVAQVLPYRAPVLQLDRLRPLVCAEQPAAAAGGANVANLTGAGVVVGVADTGIEADHIAFDGAAMNVIARGRPGDSSDPHGHGTHVTGTIGGRPGGNLAHLGGVAPDVQIVMQSVMDANGGLGGLGADLTDLFDEAYQREVRIHNNSWGANVGAAYTTSSFEIDRFVWEHPDMLVVIAAGNAGTCLDPEAGGRRTDAGCVDWFSLGAPGTSKNALVVGASRSDRTAGGWSTLRHRDLWPTQFPDNPIGDELVSGDREALAGFSSRGLCDDNRIKPDVVAPGTDIAAPRSSLAPSYNFAGMVPQTQRKFGYMSGTSMATPVVSGIAALVRQYLQRDRAVAKPSAALLKAILINGARPLQNPHATKDRILEGVPNAHQGFGCVDLARSIPLDGSFALGYVDTWSDPAKAFAKLGTNRRRYEFTTTKNAPLRITLAYTDYWGRGLQNNLDLQVERPTPQQGAVPKKLIGNQNQSVIGKMPDPTNNVESVKLEDAETGNWVVTVTATNLLHDGQHFALVVAGALASDDLQET